MNSDNLYSGEIEKKQTSQFSRMQPVDFSLTNEQYLIIQHFMPKKYSLIEQKNSKRIQNNSAHKLAHDETPNISKLSQNYQNTEDIEGRTKRLRTKKVDRYLQDQVPKVQKRGPSEKLSLDDQLMQCSYILNLLKKHKNSYPFLTPVNPKLDGAYNYLDVIKQPMDLSTIQKNLKNGEYQTAGQFHGDINKIWYNSYGYNEKTSPIYKLTIEIQKYYKSLTNGDVLTKKLSKAEKLKSKAQKGQNKSIGRKDTLQLEKSGSIVAEDKNPQSNIGRQQFENNSNMESQENPNI